MYMDLSDNDIKNIERDALLFVQEKCLNLRHLRLARKSNTNVARVTESSRDERR